MAFHSPKLFIIGIMFPNFDFILLYYGSI